MSTEPRSGAVAANQQHKRTQIVDAARAVLAADGMAGATARAIADASPLTKSAVHYYFDDVHEIVDLALAAHVGATVEALRAVAARHPDPAERLRAVLVAYLHTFAERPYAAYLWFEYWIDAGRRGTVDQVAVMLGSVEELLAELLANAGVPDPAAAARTVLSWLLGSIVQQHVRPGGPEALRAEIETVLRGVSGR